MGLEAELQGNVANGEIGVLKKVTGFLNQGEADPLAGCFTACRTYALVQVMPAYA